MIGAILRALYAPATVSPPRADLSEAIRRLNDVATDVVENASAEAREMLSLSRAMDEQAIAAARSHQT